MAGRYELGALLGAGGMARVHRGTDTVLGRAVAIKVFRMDVDAAESARIQDERRTLASLNHPGLVAVFDAGVWSRPDGSASPFMVMELVEGPTLADCCLDGSLTTAEVAAIGSQLGDALAHVHERGVVHRDVKPANILLAAGGRPKLTDFGIARIADSAGHTQTGMLVGTAPYLSPEQLTGEQVGPPTDVYALGLVLLEACTGRREYPGDGVQAALARLSRSPHVPADLPEPLAGVLTRMTARSPHERPTASEVALALGGGSPLPPPVTAVLDQPGALATRPLTARLPRPAARPAARRPQPAQDRGVRGVLAETLRGGLRNRAVLAGLLTLLTAIGVVVALALGSGGDAPPAAEPAQSPAPAGQLERDLAELRRAVTP